MRLNLLFCSLVFVVNVTDASSLAAENIYTHALNESLAANASAQSLFEWESSGLTPRDLFARFRAQAGASSELCDALLTLSSQDLALFEAELESPLNQERWPCSENLLEKLKSHWKNTHKNTRNKIQTLDTQPSLPPDPDAHRLPSLEKQIDPSTTGSRTTTGGLKRGEIAITLDDGPHPTRTRRILAILKSWGVRATFFELGFQAHARPKVSQAVLAQGHSIGSHTWDHPNLPKLAETDLPGAFSQIDRGRRAVEVAIGETFPFFRFPYGATNEVLSKYVAEQGLVSFFWNMDSMDWKLRDPAELLKNLVTILDQNKPGTILFHDIHEQDVLVMDGFLQALKDRNYATVVFVPQKLSAPLP